MPELLYSNDALNAKSSFYRSNFVVYVEGDDDLMFWHEIFERVPNFKTEIESLGSCEAVDDMITRIESGEVHAIAARDSDYLRLKGKTSSSFRVLYTHGYSIENSLVSEDSMLAAAKSFSRNPKIDSTAVKDWLDHLEKNLRSLLTLDLATSLSAKPVTVLGDNTARFTTTQRSHILCNRKCSAAIASAKSLVPSRKEAEAKNLLKGACTISSIRGHFLFSSAQKFISAICTTNGKNVSIPYDPLYAFFILFFGKKLDTKGSIESGYVNDAQRAAATFAA